MLKGVKDPFNRRQQNQRRESLFTPFATVNGFHLWLCALWAIGKKNTLEYVGIRWNKLKGRATSCAMRWFFKKIKSGKRCNKVETHGIRWKQVERFDPLSTFPAGKRWKQVE